MAKIDCRFCGDEVIRANVNRWKHATCDSCKRTQHHKRYKARLRRRILWKKPEPKLTREQRHNARLLAYFISENCDPRYWKIPKEPAARPEIVELPEPPRPTTGRPLRPKRDGEKPWKIT
jgi:hypothetical protein